MCYTIYSNYTIVKGKKHQLFCKFYLYIVNKIQNEHKMRNIKKIKAIKRDIVNNPFKLV